MLLPETKDQDTRAGLLQRRRFPFCKAWLTCLFFLLPALLSAQAPDTVSIKCRIVDDIRHEPVPKVRLTLTGQPLKDQLALDADREGRCPFASVPPGRYTLGFDKAGFFPPENAGSGIKGTITVDATNPPEVDLGTIVLVKARSISGVVRWDNEEPAEKVIVHALLVKRGRAAYASGDVILVPTNAGGEFKLDNLRPGRYVVYSYVIGLALFLKPRIALPVFYPNSPVPNTGDAIDMTNTAEVNQILMHLREATGVPVEGVVQASDAFPKGSGLFLGLTLEGNPAQVVAGVEATSGQPFRIPNVPPGSYRFVTVAKGKDYYSLRDFQPLHVGAEPIAGIKITLMPRPPIEGLAEVVGAASPGQPERVEPAANLALSGQSDALGIYGIVHGLSNQSGNFHLDDAADGETYMLKIAAPPGTYISRVDQNGRQLDGGPFPLVGGAGKVHILLRDDGATVQGMIRKKDGVEGAGFAVLAPSDRKREHLFRTAKAADDGSFQFHNVAPGEYDLFGFNRNDEDQYLEPVYLSGFASQSVKVTVAAKESRRQDVDVVDVTPRGAR